MLPDNDGVQSKTMGMWCDDRFFFKLKILSVIASGNSNDLRNNWKRNEFFLSHENSTLHILNG